MKKSKSFSYDPQWKKDYLWHLYSRKQKIKFLIKEIDHLHLEIANRTNDNESPKQENN